MFGSRCCHDHVGCCQWRQWPQSHFNPAKDTTLGWVVSHVLNDLPENHCHKRLGSAYLAPAEQDKSTCVARFNIIYGEHIKRCCKICGLMFLPGGDAACARFPVYNRTTLSVAWSQCSAENTEELSKFCWMLYHSHTRGYEMSVQMDLQTVAENRVMDEMCVTFLDRKPKPESVRVAAGEKKRSTRARPKKTCVQQLFSQLLNRYRARTYKRNQSTKIGLEHPSLITSPLTDHVMDEDTDKEVKRRGRDSTVFYIGRRSTEHTKETFIWRKVRKGRMVRVYRAGERKWCCL